ncbi:MAG: hypothetical protein ACFFBC_02550 [Promethearchaeota archaeon]
MSEIQETDKTMRAIAMVGGIIAFIESILQFTGTQVLSYGFGKYVDGVLGIIFAILAILLSIRPIHYTPVFLSILGVLLIVFSILIGGIFVLLAAFTGAIS